MQQTKLLFFFQIQCGNIQIITFSQNRKKVLKRRGRKKEREREMISVQEERLSLSVRCGWMWVVVHASQVGCGWDNTFIYSHFLVPC